jgi:hypothetical protein
MIWLFVLTLIAIGIIARHRAAMTGTDKYDYG